MIESAAGEMIAAPIPWTAREAISTAARPAQRPQASDASVKSDQPGHEDPSPAEQVGRPAAEKQEAAEGDRVGDDHPLDVSARCSASVWIDGIATLTIDDVEDRHEERRADDGEDQPAARVQFGGGVGHEA